ncbi:succinate dehydrogenase cytochrome b-556 subunit [Polynucleobacter sp. SHI8]|uniref:succinate dehydrogenase, cytochrome b556 subunit n=1 Tax=unclassified Polynucleobacter TaxID=2640945 RepID=UPI002491D183|nr:MULTISPECIES: succinate dehydrogenase, cytochrome b556 subunit [unclassified Polynucleobacter]BDW11207.1 succinate dehydrogenase cytochrome b-556 subunit [Polynucleobacter sp. SHI2]BDW13653.1 succinate dehydrogenase cytochrome b-556 subunit [Polynucleobacter sp. SHI8]
MSETVDTSPKRARREFKNIGYGQILTSYKLPWSGKVSIMHRASGALLFLSLPFILYLFDKSLTSELSFITFSEVVGHPLVKLFLLALIWAFLHHFCAGIRFLMLDLHKGIEKTQIQKSAVTVLAVSLSLTAVLGAKLFNLF